MAVAKIDPKVIFASEAPAQDTPAVFTNKTVGWGESRKNGGRPTIKQSNALQQETDLKILWLNENSVTPFDSSIDYPENAVVIKDDVFKILKLGVWELFLDKSSVGLSNVDNTSDLNKPVSTATQTALNLKADKSTTYTKSEVNNALDLLKPPYLSSDVVDGSQTQDQINLYGGKKYDMSVGGYPLNARVLLDNGDIVKSTIPNNTNNPNTNMLGWINESKNIENFDSTFSISNKYPDEQQAISALTDRTILFLPNNKDISGELSTGNADLFGQGYSTKIVVADNSYGVELKQSVPNWEKRSVKNLSAHGSFGSRSGKGVTFDPSDSSAGRWNLDYIGFQNLDIAIYKPVGNIGNTYTNISVEFANYGYRAKSGVNMHSGSDIIRDSHFRYIDVWSVDLQNDVDGFGQFTIDNTIFEGSTGGGIRIDCGNITPYAPITIRNCWFELLATASTVVRDGVSEVPRHIKLIDTPVAFIESTYFYNIELINSNLIADKCRIDTAATGRVDLIVDANSSLTVTNLITQGAVGRVPLVKSIASANPIWEQNNTLRGESTKGLILDASAWGGVVKKANPFTGTVGTTTWLFNVIKGAYTTACVDDGLLETGVMQFFLHPASEVTLPTAFNVTSGKWYVWGVDIKQIGGAGVATFGANNPKTKTLFGDIYFEENKWTSNFGISQSTTTESVFGLYLATFGGAPLTVEIQNFYIVEFDKESDALAFANSRLAISKTV